MDQEQKSAAGDLSMGDPLVLRLDATIFSAPVVMRVCYAFADRAHCEPPECEDRQIVLRLRPNKPDADLKNLKQAFEQLLIDFALRAHIEAQTHEIRIAIVTAALIEAGATERTT